MGCASSRTPEERRAAARSRELEREAAREHFAEQSRIKLLLLGAGESGKSTLFKQMKMLYGQGFSDADRRTGKAQIIANVVNAAKALVTAGAERGADYASISEHVDAVAAFEWDDADEFDEEIASHVAALWAHAEAQRIWALRGEYMDALAVQDNNKVLLDKVEEIGAEDYLPTDEDMLQSRQKTTGIIEQAYVIEGITFVMLDVGGQRNERKKWIHCFDAVNALIFVAALSDYDQVLYEDAKQNRMVESLVLFDDMCNSRHFERTDVILFLNKRDIFAEKVARKDIAEVPEFSDYPGAPNSSEGGAAYFRDKFLGLNRTGKQVYSHVTCATDTDNVNHVFGDCRKIILNANLKASGLGGMEGA